MVFGPELAMESRPGGEKRPSALPTLLLVLGVEEGVQMLPLHPQMGGGEWDEEQELTMGWVEKSAFRGAVCLEGDRENQRQGA